jgi:hypothetical protein
MHCKDYFDMSYRTIAMTNLKLMLIKQAHRFLINIPSRSVPYIWFIRSFEHCGCTISELIKKAEISTHVVFRVINRETSNSGCLRNAAGLR